jgi:hypothetical protein
MSASRRAGSASVATVVTLAAGVVLTAPAAGAQSGDFPDLGRFSSVDPAAYVRPFSYAERWANGYLFFQTPGGISCAVGASTWCTGPLPAVAVPPGGCGSVDFDNRGFQIRTTPQACVPSSDPLLNPGEKLTNATYDTTCAVSSSLLACITAGNRHGFVLQPSGSWAF